MKIYAAIGRFKWSENVTSVAFAQNTKADFTRDLRGNEFIPYIVITEPMLKKLLACEDSLAIYEIVKKMTSNISVWDAATDYIEQCSDFLMERFEKAKAEEAELMEAAAEPKRYEVTKYSVDGETKHYGILTEDEVKPMLRGYKFDEELGLWYSKGGNIGYDLKEVI